LKKLRDRYRGLLIGTAVGDAIGLPAEGIPRARARRMFTGPWRHRFAFGRGMISDDTEHTLFVSQCLLAHPDSAERFGRRLGCCLKWWFASLPAGVGMATARACIKLGLGFGYRRSGVDSAGNGPAMRVAPIGAFFPRSPDDLNAFTQACTLITHTDPKALIGAMAISQTAAWIVREDLREKPSAEVFCRILADIAPENGDWRSIVSKMGDSLAKNASVDEFAASLGLEREITGYIYHTVPIVLYAWHRHFGDYRATVGSVLDCGGDTDTTGAIVGALAGLTVGESGIPPDWVDGVKDWPRTTASLRRVADRLSELAETGNTPGPVRYFWPGLIVRNVWFLAIVLFHGFRRLLPPY
jgi:ADP-ribosylglycohydrolase